MVHWVVFLVGGNFDPLVIALDVMLSSGYVRRHLLNKEIFQLWYFPEDICMQINKEQLGFLWRYFYSSPPGRTLQVILEAIIKSKLESGLGQYTTKIILEQIRQ